MLHRALVALLVLVLLSPALGGFAPRASDGLPADFTDPQYLCAHDPVAAVADRAAEEDGQEPPFKDPGCSLCVVLAGAVCPVLTLSAPVPVAAELETLRRADPVEPVLANIALPPEARAPPHLI